MDKTLFIASFPDLSSFDFSKTGIKVGNIDNSDYFFSSNDSNYVHSFIMSLKSMAGNYDIVFVPATDNIISNLEKENIKCIVLYPDINSKDKFLLDMKNSGIEESYVSMVADSWNFIISKLEKKDYDYKFVLGEDDNILDVLNKLLSKREILGSSSSDTNTMISDYLVNSIFSYCLLNENEINNGKPLVQSTFCEGIKYDYLFSTKRLSEKKEDITLMINSIDSVEQGISVLELGHTCDGKEWTKSLDAMEKVMALGVSSGELLLPFSRELDKSLKGSVPYVIKSETLIKQVTI